MKKESYSLADHSVIMLSLELLGSRELSNNLTLSKSFNIKRGIRRDILVPSLKTLYDLHLSIQKLFGWKDFYLHKYSLSDEDFTRITRGNPDIYKALCGSLFRSFKAQYFDWCWHDLVNIDPDIVRLSADMESSFYNERRRMEESSLSNSSFGNDLGEMGARSADKANSLIERLTLEEIFKPGFTMSGDSYSQESADKWRKALLKKAELCMARLLSLRDSRPEVFYSGSAAFEELDSWEESYEKLLRWRANDLLSHARFGLSYEEARSRHLGMFHSCFESSRQITENFNPRLDPFFCELLYKYDGGDEWKVRIRCLNIFKAKRETDRGYEPDTALVSPGPVQMVAETGAKDLVGGKMLSDPGRSTREYHADAESGSQVPEYDLGQECASKATLAKSGDAVKPADGEAKASEEAISWVDTHGKEAPKEIVSTLEQVAQTHTPKCFRYDGVSVMEDIGGIEGFYEFLKTLSGRDKEAIRKMRRQAEIYGWSEKTDPASIEL